jgi:uncharacterized protein YuzE
MHAFDVLGDPVRRRILELLADGEHSAGEVGAIGHDTVDIEEGVTVDLDAGGHIIGIEILDAAERLGPKSLQSIGRVVWPPSIGLGLRTRYRRTAGSALVSRCDLHFGFLAAPKYAWLGIRVARGICQLAAPSPGLLTFLPRPQYKRRSQNASSGHFGE